MIVGAIVAVPLLLKLVFYLDDIWPEWRCYGQHDAKAVKGEPTDLKLLILRGESEPDREAGLAVGSNEMRETAAPPPIASQKT